MKWMAGLARALLVLAFVLPTGALPVAESRHASAETAAVAWGQVSGVHAQAQEAADEDDRVPVQVWTIVAAAGAAGVGLLGFAIRWKLGRVAPPPKQPEGGHH